MELDKDYKTAFEFDIVEGMVLGEAIRVYAEILQQDIFIDNMIKLFVLQRICNKFMQWSELIAEQEKFRETLLKAWKYEKEAKGQ